jgi:hypothetical protein
MFDELQPRSIEPRLVKWQELMSAGSLSVPVGEGIFAVVISTVANNCSVSDTEAAALLAEGAAITHSVSSTGTTVEKILSPTKADLDRILQDPKYSGLCLIGEGSVGNFYVAPDHQSLNVGKPYDYRRVAEQTTHLKRGKIYQRMCSVAGRSDVPWGLFAATSLGNILIAQTPFFVPQELHTRPEQGLMPLTEIVGESSISYAGLVAIAKALSARPNCARA